MKNLKFLWLGVSLILLISSYLMNLSNIERVRNLKIELKQTVDYAQCLETELDKSRTNYNDLLFEYDTDFIEYYHYSEFDSRDSPGSGKKLKESFKEKFELFTKIYGEEVGINSGYRTPSHNKRVGGATHSAHKDGTAADISCRDDADKYRMVYAAMQAGFPRIGIGSTFIHLDNKNEKDYRIWLYDKKRK